MPYHMLDQPVPVAELCKKQLFLEFLRGSWLAVASSLPSPTQAACAQGLFPRWPGATHAALASWQTAEQDKCIRPSTYLNNRILLHL